MRSAGASLHPHVLVSLGTNDTFTPPETFRKDVRQVLALTGSDRCVVWFTIFRQGETSIALNRILREEADRDGSLRLVDWAALVRRPTRAGSPPTASTQPRPATQRGRGRRRMPSAPARHAHPADRANRAARIGGILRGSTHSVATSSTCESALLLATYEQRWRALKLTTNRRRARVRAARQGHVPARVPASGGDRADTGLTEFPAEVTSIEVPPAAEDPILAARLQPPRSEASHRSADPSGAQPGDRRGRRRGGRRSDRDRVARPRHGDRRATRKRLARCDQAYEASGARRASAESVVHTEAR